MKNSLLLFIAILLFGCSSESDPAAIPLVSDSPSTSFKLKKMISDYTTVYSYSGNILANIETLSNDGILYKSELIYENIKLVKVKRYKNGVYQQTADKNFIYSGEKISSWSATEDNILFRHDFTYNAEGQMINDKQYDNGVYNSEVTYTYDANNNIKTTNNNVSSTINYQYDNKINPLYYIYPVAVSKVYAYSKNNMTSRGSITYEYEYSVNNLPIKQTTINGFGNNIVRFEYE